MPADVPALDEVGVKHLSVIGDLEYVFIDLMPFYKLAVEIARGLSATLMLIPVEDYYVNYLVNIWSY